MTKLTIPRLRYLAQDADGNIFAYASIPCIANDACDGYEVELWEYPANALMFYIVKGITNPNWRESLIDLDTEDYEFEDGILRRIDK